ncbi:MAG: molybdopterin-dependent oxidoreductase, partial [Candidatus Hadarchaeum sp.]
MAEVKRTICMGCHCECGVLVTVENGKVTKIIGDPDHPQNEGAICVRGMSYQQLLYHPDRLRYPMERQPNGEWKRISWDEAMDKIASKFKELIDKYGPESPSSFCVLTDDPGVCMESALVRGRLVARRAAH